MSAECTSCGHLIPAGQFRCGKCGALAPRESLEDFGSLTEVLGQPEAPNPFRDADKPAHAPPVAAPRPAPAVDERGPPLTEERAEQSPAASEADSSQQVETVPKGTFASEAPQAPIVARKEKEAAHESKGDALRDTPTLGGETTGRSAAASSTQRVKQTRPVERPPFLASEILREDLTPLSPGANAMWLATQIGGGLGLLAALLVGYDSVHGIVVAAGCAALLALGRMPLMYITRAGMVTLLAALGLAGATTTRVAMGVSQDDSLLSLACVLLPSALLFRTWYRAAQRARTFVVLALTVALGWAAMTSHRGLLTLGFTWQSWLPALAWYLFVILCLLSLLAFMGDETTGGCSIWASGLWVWFALFAGLRSAMESGTFGPSQRTAAYALNVAEAAFAPALAVGLAQLCARAFVSRQRKPAAS